MPLEKVALQFSSISERITRLQSSTEEISAVHFMFNLNFTRSHSRDPAFAGESGILKGIVK